MVGQPRKPASFENILHTHFSDDECNQTISLAAAAHLSARFPLASPPGVIRSGSGINCAVITGEARTTGPYVDGGYFDNSGAASVQRAVQALRKAEEQKEAKHRASCDLLEHLPARAACQQEFSKRKIIVLHTVFRDSVDEEELKDKIRLPSLFEFVTPFQAVLSARGVLAEAPIEQLCNVAADDTDANCEDLNGWLAKNETANSDEQPIDFKFKTGTTGANENLVWIRSPLHSPLIEAETGPGGNCQSESNPHNMPLGWLLGDAGGVLLDRISHHACKIPRSVARRRQGRRAISCRRLAFTRRDLRQTRHCPGCSESGSSAFLPIRVSTSSPGASRPSGTEDPREDTRGGVHGGFLQLGGHHFTQTLKARDFNLPCP